MATIWILVGWWGVVSWGWMACGRGPHCGGGPVGRVLPTGKGHCKKENSVHAEMYEFSAVQALLPKVGHAPTPRSRNIEMKVLYKRFLF